ncbi:MAG: hypothetical protein ABIO86_21625 [Sphingomonas sp.]
MTAAGMSVALVERKLVGGTCVNTGCMPTKTLVASAHAAHLAGRAADFGINAGPICIDMAAVEARAQSDSRCLERHRDLDRWRRRLDFLARPRPPDQPHHRRSRRRNPFRSSYLPECGWSRNRAPADAGRLASHPV